MTNITCTYFLWPQMSLMNSTYRITYMQCLCLKCQSNLQKTYSSTSGFSLSFSLRDSGRHMYRYHSSQEKSYQRHFFLHLLITKSLFCYWQILSVGICACWRFKNSFASTEDIMSSGRMVAELWIGNNMQECSHGMIWFTFPPFAWRYLGTS